MIRKNESSQLLNIDRLTRGVILSHHVVDRFYFGETLVVIGQEISRKARQVLGPLMGAAVIAYFAYHAVQGDRGLIAWWNLRYEIDKADAQLADVEARKEALERRVALLRPQSLDRDMLEERAHMMLGAVEGDDLIVPDPTIARAIKN